LYDILTALHEKGVVVGDLNENNILVKNQRIAGMVDVDSMQFGNYACKTFIPRFTAPELLEYKADGALHLFAKRDHLSDWYAFLVIAMHLATNTDPYGGT